MIAEVESGLWNGCLNVKHFEHLVKSQPRLSGGSRSYTCRGALECSNLPWWCSSSIRTCGQPASGVLTNDSHDPLQRCPHLLESSASRSKFQLHLHFDQDRRYLRTTSADPCRRPSMQHHRNPALHAAGLCQEDRWLTIMQAILTGHSALGSAD